MKIFNIFKRNKKEKIEDFTVDESSTIKKNPFLVNSEEGELLTT